MLHVLVTGSAGTVGRPLCEELRRRGHVDLGFEIVYAASRGGERVFDMEPARRLLGFEAAQRWPEGLPFPLPQRDG
jgi:uncharacterized protein YbjT (DUF2867 family)